MANAQTSHIGTVSGRLLDVAGEAFNQVRTAVGELLKPAFSQDDPVTQVVAESSLDLLTATAVLRNNGLNPAYCAKEKTRIVVGLPKSQVPAGQFLLRGGHLSRVRKGLATMDWAKALTDVLCRADIPVFVWQVQGRWSIGVAAENYNAAMGLLPTKS